MYTWFTVMILFLSISAFGQKTVVVVEPDAGLEIGALNNAINSASDPGNTIFELRRGGLYLLNGTISHSGYTLHIRAEAGTGHRPILQPGVDDLGVSQYPFTPGGSLTLEDLYIYGIDEMGAMKAQMIAVSGNESKITIEGCYFDYSSQSIVTTNSINNDIFINNSMLRNAYRSGSSNGRIIDTRSKTQDTIIVQNSTMPNYAGKLLSGDFYANYVKIDHNTIFQGNATSVFALVFMLKADITNNVWAHVSYRGDVNSPHHAFFEIDSMGTYGDKTDADRVFNVSNNNWWTDEAFADIMEQYGVDSLYTFEPDDIEQKDTIWYKRWGLRRYVFNQPIFDTIVNVPLKQPIIQYFLDNGQIDSADFIWEPLVFKNPPPLHLDYWKFYVENDYSITSLSGPSPFIDEDPNLIGEVETGRFDFSYNDNSRSATLADGGGPLGDPRWVPYTTVSTRKINVVNSTIVKTYPNPCSELVNFEINAKEASSVRIVIYDLIGKEILSLNERVNQGVNTIPVNLNNISRSGIYLYQVQSELSNGQKNIASGKIVKR